MRKVTNLLYPSSMKFADFARSHRGDRIGLISLYKTLDEVNIIELVTPPPIGKATITREKC